MEIWLECTYSNVQVTIIAHIDVHKNPAPLLNLINCISDILVACNRLFALSAFVTINLGFLGINWILFLRVIFWDLVKIPENFLEGWRVYLIWVFKSIYYRYVVLRIFTIMYTSYVTQHFKGETFVKHIYEIERKACR